MQHSRVSDRIGLLLVLASLILSPQAARAQGSPPLYPDAFISLPSAEARTFHHWGLTPALVVPTAALQAVVDAQAGVPGFVVVSNAGPGQAAVLLNPVSEVIEEQTGGVLRGPRSLFLVQAIVMNTAMSRLEVANIAGWDSDAAGTNAFYGADVTTQAEFDWKIEQENGEQVVKVKIQGTDGFRATMKSRIIRILGSRLKNDPNPISIRWLSDGPGGSHPSYRFANQSDQIPVAPGMFEGFEAGEKLSLPGGKLPIVEVRPGAVGRGASRLIDLE